MCTENYDPCFPDQPVVDLYLPVWASLPAFRSKLAFIWAEDGSQMRNTLTYGQLNSSTDLITGQLLGPLKLRRGDPVVIICSPGLRLDFVKILFSCQRAGLVCVPVSEPYSAMDHLVRVLLQTKPKAVIANRASSFFDDSRLPKLRWLFVEDFQLEYSEDISSTHPLSFPSEPASYSGCGPRDVYLVQYTSGATGIPKPVLVTAGAAAHNVREARKSYQLQPGSVIVSWLPQFHDCGLMFLLLTIVSGATLVLTSPSTFVNRPRLWLELVTQFRATCTPVPSFALPLVVRRGAIHQGGRPLLELSSLRNLVIINEPIYRDLIVRFVDEFACVGLLPSCISPSYGLAENCTFVSTAWRSTMNQSSTILILPTHNGLLPSARLALNEEGGGEADEIADEIEIVVVDRDKCEPVEDGVEGEIWVSSPSNASGYLGYPSLSQQVFAGRLRGTASRSFVRTGDRGIVKDIDHRYLFVTGRASDIIEIKSSSSTTITTTTPIPHVCHPHYLEKVAYDSSSGSLRGGCIAAFEMSHEVVVVVAELQKGHDQVVAAGSGERVYENICQRINTALVKHIVELDQVMRLVILVRSGSLPKTTSGKMQRWAAKAKLMRGEMSVVEAALFGPLSLLGLNKSTRKGKLLVKALLSLPDERGSDPLEPQSHLLTQLIFSSL
ncbi:hypothetical protein H6P81_009624 [Aristolochia fimbriata]|uniref:AMP-dependent synthetase/ligase domain-containing protein n=1 Tax=Aristolochia fimbriata TaxID=158543 RepID=A0AAV7EM01_ARIFI|nr:hypothetical protein H6P81_009624 [Aristolochia fimbriata]